ncbi:mitochondrial carrier domain-containing protein [Radiomyces spectabilis]|uniref:mitochondrial carrier domain-containing protein n=1 Tax=Radiomyces spectabilis TaxID=64574 RepID=UPI00221ED53E|nr:mitochondrial carrier domain-containing protein [Radiomyces spectabilis]KAI8374460.1 mitochondrial carrier domain-containing protein [Radiomyces spectabilis]
MSSSPSAIKTTTPAPITPCSSSTSAQPAGMTKRNLGFAFSAFTPTNYPTVPYSTVLSKRKKAKDATSVGGSTAIARTIIMQSLYLFYRTPVKLFRPLRVDYLIMARALMPVDDKTSKRFSFRYTSIGMITHAVKTKGWNFIPRHILPPLLANTMIGTVLYTTYIVSLPLFHSPCAYQLHRPFPPPPFSSVFLAGCLAGAAQSIVATPLDSLKVRFEVSDLLEGKHRSMYQFAKSTLKELGLASAYRGFTLTLMRDSLACGLFFATFEWVKQQGYYYFLDEMYHLKVDSTKTLSDLESGWNDIIHSSSHEQETAIPETGVKKERPPLLLEPMFVILAGAAAAIAYQVIDHPFSRIHSIFYIAEGQSEFAHKSSREPVRKLYARTWEQCKIQMRLHNGSWRKFLYHEFGSTVLKVVPATSIGFLVFELVKREVDFRRLDFDAITDAMQD